LSFVFCVCAFVHLENEFFTREFHVHSVPTLSRNPEAARSYKIVEIYATGTHFASNLMFLFNSMREYPILKVLEISLDLIKGSTLIASSSRIMASRRLVSTRSLNPKEIFFKGITFCIGRKGPELYTKALERLGLYVGTQFQNGSDVKKCRVQVKLLTWVYELAKNHTMHEKQVYEFHMGELMKTEQVLDRNLCNLFAVLMSLVTLIWRTKCKLWPNSSWKEARLYMPT